MLQQLRVNGTVLDSCWKGSGACPPACGSGTTSACCLAGKRARTTQARTLASQALRARQASGLQGKPDPGLVIRAAHPAGHRGARSGFRGSGRPELAGVPWWGLQVLRAAPAGPRCVPGGLRKRRRSALLACSQRKENPPRSIPSCLNPHRSLGEPNGVKRATSVFTEAAGSM